MSIPRAVRPRFRRAPRGRLPASSRPARPPRRRPISRASPSSSQKRGLHVDNVVSGDAGCTDPVLAPTAIAFDASGLDQPTPVRIYLYVFRNRATFERLRSTVDACARVVRHRPRDLRDRRAVAVRPRRPGSVGHRSSRRRSGRASRSRPAPATDARRADRQTTRRPRIFRAMTRRWTWLVPSPISVSLASRR